MPYRIKEGMPPGEELRAVAIGQIDAAQAVLRREDLPIAKRVHETRKHLKKIRALLCLLKTPLGDRYRAIDRRLRDAGRLLSAARDATVIRNAFEALVAGGVEGADAEALKAIGAVLRDRAQAAERESDRFASASAKVDDALGAVREDALAWELSDYDVDDLARACKATYRRGRREMRRVRKRFTAEHFHEWRKGVKEHWYHMRLLDDPRRIALDDLGELLGHANDLAVLGGVLALESVRDDALEREVEQRRLRDVRDALEQGATLYESRPRAFGAALRDSL